MPICRTIPRIPTRPSRIKDLCLLLSSLSIFYLLLHHHPPPPHPSPTTKAAILEIPTINTATTIRHLLFSIASSSSSYANRKPYIKSWYHPHTTRALVFLDRPTPNNDPTTLPQAVVSADTSQFPYTFPRGLRSAIRVARIVKEAVDLDNLNAENKSRWFVFGDDDTVFFPENLVRVLSRYDYEKWFYIGSSSESYEQNEQYSFDMAFGGGGFVLSASLARVLARVLDSCLMRYPHLYGSDARIFSCLVELGVGLTHEPGFHQVDFRGNLFGILSAHPLSPLLSLHHLDVVDPIYPGMSRAQALEHFMVAVKADPARIVQQTVCYDRSNSLTVSVAWGYVVQVIEGNQFLPDLLSVPKTFSPWRRSKDVFSSHYMFNTRDYPKDPCKRPFAFFLERVVPGTDMIYTFYMRDMSVDCSRSRRPVRNLERIRIVSRKLDDDPMKVPRRQCCDVLSYLNKTMSIAIRQCEVDELIAMRA